MRVNLKKLSLILASSMLFSCASNNVELLPIENTNQIQTFSAPEFNQRKLNALNIPTNSVAEQKKKQVKLHTYYFNSYCNGASSYSSSDDNAHIKMLKKGEASLSSKIDSNNDGKMTLDEINKFVSTENYIKYFRDTYINFSYAKLDSNKDKKLSMDEFNKFNSTIKDPNVPDFQLLEEFADYDYNSSRSLELEEYEDFFMSYLLVKVGAEK